MTFEGHILTQEPKVLSCPPRSDVRPEDLPPPDDIFFYGWREVECHYDGKNCVARIPLTLEDMIHPQSEDYIMQTRRHSMFCNDLWNGLEAHIGHEPGTVILHGVGIDWGVYGVELHIPDLAVIRCVQVAFNHGIFYLKQSQGHVVLVLEVTSQNTWRADTNGYRSKNKVKEYARAGIPFYIIVDDEHCAMGHPPPIMVLVLAADGSYQKQEADARGWYWIEPLQLWIGPYQNWIAWYDKDENKLNTHLESEQARKLAEEKVYKAEERIRELEALLAAR